MCSTTMTHMCSWSGGTSKCHRCGDGYCNYHSEINNTGASGGHCCWCSEGRKNPAFGANCTGDFFQCPSCKQKVCHYHGPTNNGGSIGGHNGCSGKKCQVVVGGLTCGGKVSECAACSSTFCSNHIKSGLKHGVNGHGCDLGCDTTTHTKVNCVGKKKDLIKCKLCFRADNNYSFCAYHAMPVRTLVSLGADEGGGHVCQGYTTGSMLFGDNAGDLFLLAADMAVSVASAGTINPAAATIAGNSLKIALHEVFELIGIDELTSLRPKIKELVDKQSAKKREKELKKLPKAEPLDKSDTEDLIKALQKVSKFLGAYNKAAGKFFGDQVKLVQEGTAQIEGVINGINKAITIIDLAQSMKSTAEKLTKSLKKPINPLSVIDAVKECKSTMDLFASACGA